MLEIKVFIFKRAPVDRSATGAIAAGKVTALCHKAGDDAVEQRALEAKPALVCAQLSKVFCRSGDNIRSQLQQDSKCVCVCVCVRVCVRVCACACPRSSLSAGNCTGFVLAYLHDDSARRSAADGDIKEHTRVLRPRSLLHWRVVL